MKGGQADKTRLLHIPDAIQEIKSYLKDLDFSSFQEDSKTKFATIKQIEIIGEAANHISTGTKELYSEINWRRIIALRNILIHEYFGVDENIIWTIVTKDIIEFEKQINQLLKNLID